MSEDSSYPHRRLQDLLPELLDPQFGIFTYIGEHPVLPGAPQLFRYVAHTGDTRALGYKQNFSKSGGAGLTRDAAMLKTIGEGLERYCSAIYDKDSLPLSSYQQATFNCIHPEQLNIYDSSQFSQPDFPFKPINTDTQIRWVKGFDLSNHQTCYLPAALVYTPYSYAPEQNEPAIFQPISTGASCHCSAAESIINGLCEVIERDAFAITWQTQLTRPKIDLSSLGPCNQTLVQRYQQVGYQVHLVNITTDTNIPTIMAVLRNEQQGALPLVVSAAANLDPNLAVQHALEELGHSEQLCYQLMKNSAKAHNQTEDHNAHLHFWSNQAQVDLSDFLINSSEHISLNQLPNLNHLDKAQGLKQLIENITNTGHRALYCDITSEDLAPLGIHVTKSLIPGFQPLTMGHSVRALGTKRLWQLAEKLQLSGRSKAQGDNPYPHPFP